ncbi:iron ABC transporter ATP-binding protein [Agromyces sp. NPDC058110]|uniref:iron ABC transporter ATP-binding protein n=1 Tax=Agromyces sp. NPDC058110 TaxID=3346345 RepID=UPI0036D97D7F
MPRPAVLQPARRLRSALGTTLLVAASVALLAGCSPSGADPSTTAEPGASGAPAATEPGATTEPSPVETVEPPTPFEIACDALVTPDQLYAFNPNFGAAPDYEPEAATVVTVATDAAGTACGYLNQTSGELVEVAVATPSADALTGYANDAATSSNAVPTYGTPPEVSGYFEQGGSHGQVQVFTGDYWVVLDSTDFFEPGDAQGLVEAVISNLPTS